MLYLMKSFGMNTYAKMGRGYPAWPQFAAIARYANVIRP
jgi:hypothetical protein